MQQNLTLTDLNLIKEYAIEEFKKFPLGARTRDMNRAMNEDEVRTYCFMKAAFLYLNSKGAIEPNFFQNKDYLLTAPDFESIPDEGAYIFGVEHNK